MHCTSTPQQSSPEPTSSVSQQGEYDDDYNDEYDEQEAAAASDDVTRDVGLLHPRLPTVWETQVALASQPPSLGEAVAECMATLPALTTEAGTASAMASAVDQIAGLVQPNPAPYHWCFYRRQLKLENQLKQPGALLTEHADKFFAVMRSQWILARALDRVTGQLRYFRYARQRYRALSRDVFGRQLDVMIPAEKARPHGYTEAGGTPGRPLEEYRDPY